LVSVRTFSVFVENPAGAAIKHLFDERQLVLEARSMVSRPYPYHYGFLLDTHAADGDNLDCYILSNRNLQTGDIVECAAVGLMEQWEDGLVDHNVLACPVGEATAVTASVTATLSDFVAHVFDHVPGKSIRAGRFLDAAAALQHIGDCQMHARKCRQSP
jgi:inorganic pyrophosphatase